MKLKFKNNKLLINLLISQAIYFHQFQKMISSKSISISKTDKIGPVKEKLLSKIRKIHKNFK